jgi:hypothetical protein
MAEVIVLRISIISDSRKIRGNSKFTLLIQYFVWGSFGVTGVVWRRIQATGYRIVIWRRPTRLTLQISYISLVWTELLTAVRMSLLCSALLCEGDSKAPRRALGMKRLLGAPMLLCILSHNF